MDVAGGACRSRPAYLVRSLLTHLSDDAGGAVRCGRYWFMGEHAAVRLLCIPGRQHENSYFKSLLSALEQRGVQIIEPRSRGLYFFSYDVLHINFPTHHVTEEGLPKATILTIVFALYLLAARCLGRSIVYTVHDVIPFKNRHPLLIGLNLFLIHRLASGFIFLSQSSREAFVREYRRHAGKKWSMVPHGPYPSEILNAQTRQRLRAEITAKPDAFIVGFLGAIKPYKNVAALQSLPERLPDGRPVHIVVAGRPEQGHGEAVAMTLAAFPPERVTRIDRRLADPELSRLIQAVDAVLLPYVKGYNSGLTMLILSNFGRLIGSSLPMFQEMRRRVGTPWVYSCGDEQARRNDFSGVVLQAAQDHPSESDRAALRQFLREVGWANVAGSTHDFYRALQRGTIKKHLLMPGRRRARENAQAKNGLPAAINDRHPARSA